MTWQTAQLYFAKAHPTASGHFPGNPIIPGALILDEVIVAIAGDHREAAMVIRSAKFLRIVRPGEKLDLRWQDTLEGSVKFECLAGDTLAVTGRLEMAES